MLRTQDLNGIQLYIHVPGYTVHVCVHIKKYNFCCNCNSRYCTTTVVTVNCNLYKLFFKQ